MQATMTQRQTLGVYLDDRILDLSNVNVSPQPVYEFCEFMGVSHKCVILCILSVCRVTNS